MAKRLGCPKSTAHRALAALRRAGFADQVSRGYYVLGDEILRMAFAYHEARPEHLRVQPILVALAARYNEAAHYAVLDGTQVVYRAKVDSPTGAIRLSSTIGGRNPAHSTGVGKMLLALKLADDAAVRDWVGDRQLERQTPHTIVSIAALTAELATIRARGYSLDDQENEVGINCLAVPIFLSSPAVPSGAISVSALSCRTPLSALVDDIAAIRELTGSKDTAPTVEERVTATGAAKPGRARLGTGNSLSARSQ
jgi:DNA-binding IclR family transcriptional regulator